MNQAEWQEIEQILQGALQLPPGERREFLDSSCTTDAQRQEVEAFLQAEEQAPEVFDQPAFGNKATWLDPEDLALPALGTVGPYKLLREIGVGGMSAVFLAERNDSHFEQQIVIKLIERRLFSAEWIGRFRTERQILARLEHPNIARILDGGAADDGRPYFVLEYVDGLRIDRYCDQNELSLRQRLEAFLEVCAAVSYAHENLIVHRDLKPGNILVTRDGRSKLLDFGIAKILHSEDFPEPVQPTRTGLHLMTPQYASPEQIQQGSVTTATDVYALGLVLFELLTGQRPYEVQGLTPAEIERVVCEETCPKPSLSLIQAGGERRQAPSANELRGDLDNIVVKALTKDPRQRYRSSRQLAEDLRRHLAGLPIQARPSTAAYRLKKFLGRNRLGVLVAATFAALVGGFILTLAQQIKRVELERDKAESTLEFTVELFEVSRPDQAIGSTVTARQLLDVGAQQIASDLQDRPVVRATVLDTMGIIYTRLGLFEPARALVEEGLEMRRALFGKEATDLAASLHSLADVHAGLGEYDEAEKLYREALEQRRRLLGDHLAVADTMSRLAAVVLQRKELEEPEALLREALEIRRKFHSPPHRNLAYGIGILAEVLEEKGDLEAAEPLALQSLAMRRQLGDRHPRVAVTLRSLGRINHGLGRTDEAAAFFEEALNLDREFLGDEHPFVISDLSLIAWRLSERGLHAKAEEHLRQAIELHERAHPGDHPSSAGLLSNLAISRGKLGHREEAEELFQQAFDMWHRLFGDQHPRLAQFHYSRAIMLHDDGDLAAAEFYYRWAAEHMAKYLPPENPATSYPQVGIGRLLTDRGQAVAAEPILRQAIEGLRRTHAEGHWRISTAMNDLGYCLAAQGRLREAEPLLLETHQRLSEWFTRGGPRWTRSIERLMNLYRDLGQPEKAAEFQAKLAAPAA